MPQRLNDRVLFHENAVQKVFKCSRGKTGSSGMRQRIMVNLLYPVWCSFGGLIAPSSDVDQTIKHSLLITLDVLRTE